MFHHYISFVCLWLRVLIIKVNLTGNKNEYEINFSCIHITYVLWIECGYFFRFFFSVSKRIYLVFTGIFTNFFLFAFSHLKFFFSGFYSIYSAITPVIGCCPRLFFFLYSFGVHFFNFIIRHVSTEQHTWNGYRWNWLDQQKFRSMSSWILFIFETFALFIYFFTLPLQAIKLELFRVSVIYTIWNGYIVSKYD